MGFFVFCCCCCFSVVFFFFQEEQKWNGIILPSAPILAQWNSWNGSSFLPKKELTWHLLHIKDCLGPLLQSYPNNVMLVLVINLKPFEVWFADHWMLQWALWAWLWDPELVPVRNKTYSAFLQFIQGIMKELY